jgi:hypothetical protein
MNVSARGQSPVYKVVGVARASSTQDSFRALDQGSCPSNPAVKLLPPTMYSIFNNKPRYIPRYESEPACDDAAASAANPAPPATAPRSGGNGS